MNNNIEFLPGSYKLPDSSNYMKLKDGENTIRILSSAIVGYEYFNTNNKPVRSKTPFKIVPDDIGLDRDGKTKKIKHFWAFVVWNYEAEKIQILEIVQSTIQSAIKAIVDNKKWGNPHGYDITITRTGEGFDTEYAVMPNPHSEIAPSILEIYKEMKIDLDALYVNKNPFENEK